MTLLLLGTPMAARISLTAERQKGCDKQARQQQPVDPVHFALRPAAGTDGKQAWTAPNPTQGWQVSFAGATTTIGPLRSESLRWSWGFAVRAWGSDHNRELLTLPAPLVTAAGNRIEHHHGPVRQQLVNGATGLEQVVTINAPVTDSQRNTVVAMSMTGTLATRQRGGTGTVVLHRGDGASLLLYHQLLARDATGRSLPVAVAVVASGLELRIETAGATFPVSVGATIERTGKLLPDLGDSAFAWFGRQLDVDGDTMVAASTRDDINGAASGAVWVFERNQDGPDAWGEVAKLAPADGERFDSFGSAVALDDDLVVVGAPADAVDDTGPGSAYIFLRNPGAGDPWVEVAKLSADAGSNDQAFGMSVAISGETVAVAAEAPDDQGAVYLFDRHQGGNNAWGLTIRLPITDAPHGLGVALSGDSIMVGGNYRPTVSVFDREAVTGTWTLTAEIAPPAGQHWYGGIALEGNLAVLSCYHFDGRRWVDSVYLFLRHHGGWNSWGMVTELTCEHSLSGRSLALSGETIAVGTSKAGISIFEYLPVGLWEHVTTVQLGDSLTGPLALSGDIVVAGTRSSARGTESGAVFVLGRDHGGADAWQPVVKKEAPDSPSARFRRYGSSVAVSSDSGAVSTVAVGSPGEQHAAGSGAVYIYTIDADGVANRIARIDAGPDYEASALGSSVAISGSTIVASTVGRNSTSSGDAYLIENHPLCGWVMLGRLHPSGVERSDGYARAVAIWGDTVLVAAPLDDLAGAVYLFARNQWEWSLLDKLTAADGAPSDNFGLALAIDGDTAVISSPGSGEGGAVYLFEHGPGETWTQQAKLAPAGLERGDGFGRAVAISGEEVVVGAPGDDDLAPEAGAVYVFSRHHGGPDAWGQVAKLTTTDGGEFGSFGGGVVSIGGDLIAVGEPSWAEPGFRPGSVSLFHRRGSREWIEQDRLLPDGGSSGQSLGVSVAIDRHRVLAGAPGDDALGWNAGAVYSYLYKDEIFADGFEPGDTSAWSLSVR